MYIYNLIQRVSKWLAMKTSWTSRQFAMMLGVFLIALLLITAIWLVMVRLQYGWRWNLVIVALGGLLFESPDLYFWFTHKKRIEREKVRTGTTQVHLADQVSAMTRNDLDQGDTRMNSESVAGSNTPGLFEPTADSREQYIRSLTPEELTVEANRVYLYEQNDKKLKAEALSQSSTTVYYDSTPSVKWFLKRIHRIITAWLAIGLLEVVSFYFGWGNLQGKLVIGLMCFQLLILAVGTWYTFRRIYKWRHLHVRIIGNWAYIDEAVNRFLLLNGQQQSAPILGLDNAVVKKTFVERMLALKSSTVEIQSPVPDVSNNDAGRKLPGNYDKFGRLTDVRDAQLLVTTIRRRYDEITQGITPGQWNSLNPNASH